MRSQNNVYYLHRRPARAIAVAQVQKRPSHDFLMTGFYLVTGALVGFGLANLPALSGAILTALNVLPAHVI